MSNITKDEFHIGFSGSRFGMTKDQLNTFKTVLSDAKYIENTYGSIYFLHHGDCLGADATAHNIAQDQDINVIIHPPRNPSMRAFCKDSYMTLDVKGYIDRNYDIVKASDVLVATPATEHETTRSGTWSTIRFARMQSKKIYIIDPKGHVKMEQ